MPNSPMTAKRSTIATGSAVQQHQHADAAETIGQVAAHGTEERAGDHAKSGDIAGVDFAALGIEEKILVLEKDSQEAGQADEAAESHGVKQAEPPGIRVTEDGAIVAQRFGRRLMRAVLGQEKKDTQYHKQRNQGQTKNGMPAQPARQHRTEEGGQGGTAVAGAGNAHRQALIVRRIPTAGQRQRRREAGSRHAK